MKLFLSFLLLLVFGFTNAFGQTNDLTDIESEFYSNVVSNDKITLTIEKTVYEKEDLISINGFVNNYQAGLFVFFQILGPDNSETSSFQTTPASNGFFAVHSLIPKDSAYGQYQLKAKYTESGSPVQISFTIPEPVFDPSEEKIVEEPEKEYLVLINADDDIMWTGSSCNNCESSITLSSDKKEGLSSVLLSVKGDPFAEGPKTQFNYIFEPINISNYDEIELWIKTRGSTTANSELALVDSSGKVRIFDVFNANEYPEWTNLNFPVSIFVSEDEGFDGNDITGFSVNSPIGSSMALQQIDIFLDDIKLSIPEKQIIKEKPIEPLSISINKENFSVLETVLISGKVAAKESDNPVTIQVFDPSQNLVQVEQIIPDDNNQFIFSISTLGKTFQKEGEYKIIAQYGLLEHEVESTFKISSLEPIQRYRAYDIYHINEKFYAIPFMESPLIQQRLDFIEDSINNKIENGYSVFISGDSHEEVQQTTNKLPTVGPYFVENYDGYKIFMYADNFIAIPENEEILDVEKYRYHEYKSISLEALKKIINDSLDTLTFNDILKQIWDERTDLQDDFPGVSEGDFNQLKNWAETTGWNEDERLSALIPEGHTPEYLITPFLVSDDILLQIWVERIDLRVLFPEVEHNNYEDMKKWAETTGWNEDERLSALIPEGHTPEYLLQILPIPDDTSQQQDYSIFLGIIPIAIAVIIVYKLKTRSKE